MTRVLQTIGTGVMRQHLSWTAVMTLVAGTLLGCDSQSIGGSGIIVEPTSADVIGEGSVLFTAAVETQQDLILPLVWSVDNPTLGQISESAALSAVYVSADADGTARLRYATRPVERVWRS